MQRFSQILALTLSALMLAPMAPRAAAADQTSPHSLLGPSEIDAEIARAVAEDERARDRIRGLLQRDDVRRLAGDWGIGTDALDRAVAAVDTLEGEELAQVAAQAVEVDDQLAGGITVTISLVALLLIVIIVILLVG